MNTVIRIDTIKYMSKEVLRKNDKVLVQNP